MNQTFLNNEHLCLRAVEPEDLDLMYQMENDPETWDISNFTVPYSRYLLKEYIKASQFDIFMDKQLRLVIMVKDGYKAIGTVDLSDYAPLYKRAEIGIAIQKEYRKRGYASEAVQLLENYAFKFLRLHQLYAYVGVNNQLCLNMFKTLEYERTGLLKEWMIGTDGYEDVVILQKLNTDQSII
jgi:diamine N-acetyltransferase